MKMRVILLIFLLLSCFLFTACVNKNQSNASSNGNETTYLSTLGYEEYPQNSLYPHFRYTDSGCYMMKSCEVAADNITDTLVYFAEDGSKEFVPLCGKLNCCHNSTDCDAFIAGMTFGLYNNKLNYLVDAHDIYCMELDGTAHRKITSIPTIDDGLYNYCFDSEYMYYYIYRDNGALELNRIELKRGSEPEHYNIDGIGYINFITPTDGTVFVDALGVDGKRGLYYCTLDAANQLPIEDLEHIAGINYSGDKVRYFIDGKDTRCGFYEYELSSGKTELKKEYDLTIPFGIAVYDNEFIYIEEVIPTYEEYNDCNIIPRFYVFNNNYELLCAKAIPYERHRGYYSFFAATSDKVLFSTEMWPENVEYYIDKSDIPSDMTWYEVVSGRTPNAE